MKYFIFGSALLLVLMGAGSVRSQVIVKYDSLAIDAAIGGTGGILNIDLMYGLPDGHEARFELSQFYTVQFDGGGSTPVTLQKGATVHVWWIRQSSDSCAGVITFQHFADASSPPDRNSVPVRIVQNGPENISVMTVLTVPDTGYNTIWVETGADSGASSFWLDAITILQSGTTTKVDAVSSIASSQQTVLENYPNPFIASRGTSMHLNIPKPGDASIVLTDLLGRGVMFVPLGELAAGVQDVKIVPAHPGVYLARLRVGGEFVGAPLKITAE